MKFYEKFRVIVKFEFLWKIYTLVSRSVHSPYQPDKLPGKPQSDDQQEVRELGDVHGDVRSAPADAPVRAGVVHLQPQRLVGNSASTRWCVSCLWGPGWKSRRIWHTRSNVVHCEGRLHSYGQGSGQQRANQENSDTFHLNFIEKTAIP